MRRNRLSRMVLRRMFLFWGAIFVLSVPVAMVAGWKASDARASRNAVATEKRVREGLCSHPPYGVISPSDEDYIKERALCLPSPSMRAIPFEVREPLRNGKNVPVKKRWLELPAGKSILLQKVSHEKWVPNIPDGTKLWKEFYLETEQGIELVERRLTLKVSRALAAGAQLDPAGWYFVSAYDEPEGTGKVGENTWMEVESALPRDLRAKGHLSGRALPIQRRSGPLAVSFVGHSKSEYVYPGNSACYQCHGGASVGFRGDGEAPTLAFGIHPDNLTADSLRRLVTQGALVIEEAFHETPPAANLANDEMHDSFWRLLRNNCLSCHNPDPLAAARTTAFVVDPNVPLDRLGLVKALSHARALRHADRLPLVTPGEPERSEIVLRMRGQDHRRRMPPVEGGVPEVDGEFLSIAERWIRDAGKYAPER